MSPRPDGPDAVAALYRRYGTMCLRRALRFLPPPAAEDVLQDVFLRLVVDPNVMRHGEAPGAWLYRVTTRACLDRLRATRRYSHLVAQAEAHVAASLDGEEAAEARLFLTMIERQVEDELLQVGILYYIDGLTTADIGRELAVSDRTIANRLKTLRRELQRLAGLGSDAIPRRLGGGT